MTDRLQPLLAVYACEDSRARPAGGVIERLAMSNGEIEAATPLSVDCTARCFLVTFERNAYRDRCHALERTVAYLLGREPELVHLDQSAQLEAQRGAVLEVLAAAHAVHPLPATHH